MEKGLSRSKGPDGPWEKISYQLEATLEFDGEEQPARQKLEQILDSWLGTPAPQAPSLSPPPATPEPAARIRLFDKEVAQVFPDHIEISAPISAEHPAVKNFFVAKILKELEVPYDLRLKGDLLVGVAFKASLTESQITSLSRALTWTIDKATSRGTQP